MALIVGKRQTKQLEEKNCFLRFTNCLQPLSPKSPPWNRFEEWIVFNNFKLGHNADYILTLLYDRTIEEVKEKMEYFEKSKIILKNPSNPEDLPLVMFSHVIKPLNFESESDSPKKPRAEIAKTTSKRKNIEIKETKKKTSAKASAAKTKPPKEEPPKKRVKTTNHKPTLESKSAPLEPVVKNKKTKTKIAAIEESPISTPVKENAKRKIATIEESPISTPLKENAKRKIATIEESPISTPAKDPSPVKGSSPEKVGDTKKSSTKAKSTLKKNIETIEESPISTPAKDPSPVKGPSPEKVEKAKKSPSKISFSRSGYLRWNKFVDDIYQTANSNLKQTGNNNPSATEILQEMKKFNELDGVTVNEIESHKKCLL